VFGDTDEIVARNRAVVGVKSPSRGGGEADKTICAAAAAQPERLGFGGRHRLALAARRIGGRQTRHGRKVGGGLPVRDRRIAHMAVAVKAGTVSPALASAPEAVGDPPTSPQPTFKLTVTGSVKVLWKKSTAL
jgi:hypothetical protein